MNNEQQKVCGNCESYIRNETQLNQGACNHSPPQVAAIQKQTRMGIALEIRAIYPPVAINFLACGQFIPKQTTEDNSDDT